jgi:pilus assembly protein CpaC
VSPSPRVLLASFCALSFAIFPAPALCGQVPASSAQPVAGSSQDTANELFVSVGKSVLVDSAHPISRVAIGMSEIAEATAVTPTEVMVNGKAPGETTLIIWEATGGRQFFNVTVGPSTYAANDRLESLRRELRTELPGQAVKVSSENGMIFLRGTVKDLNSSDRAIQIASTAGKVVNLLYVNVPPADPQILLKVRFASVDRSKQRQLGINLFSLGAANSIGSVTTQQFSPPTISAPGGTNTTATLSSLLNLFIFRPDINLGATIEALQTQGLLEVLAEPNVLAANGKEASFLAGGEYPYPVVQGITGGGTGAVTIQFQQFGVRLNFIPTITPRHTVRLQVAPEVSTLDFTNGVTISGFVVPGLSVRRVRTEVELSEGQSFAIGGLLDNRETETFEKIPFIGDVPVLGKFFQSINRTKTNTELLVIVTPEIVAPIPADAPLPELKYPVAFLPPNSNIPMRTPGPDVTGAKPIAPPPPAMPIEQLMQSLQPEQPLVIDSPSSAGGGSYGGGAQPGMPATPTPTAPAPQ